MASADVKTAWDLHIGDMLGAAKDQGVSGAAAHVQIRALFNAKPTAKAPSRRNISYIIMPSKSLLDQIDPERTMTAAECRAALDEDLVKFDSMLKCPVVFEALVPDWDAEDYIRLHESFYIMEPLDERWGKWVSWKCMCEGFFANGICGHSTLMALLYDSTLEFPAEYSKQSLPSNAKAKKPSAWAEVYEEEEGPARTERWRMQQRDLVITRIPKVCAAGSDNLNCLIVCLITGTRP